MAINSTLLFYSVISIILLLLACSQVNSCSHGEVRLENITADSFRGTPEVCVAGRWNGVCTNGSDSLNQIADVVCRQYGCYIGQAQHGSKCSEHTINVECSGSENNLTSCDIRDSSVCTQDSGLCVEVNCFTTFCVNQGLLPYGDANGDHRLPTGLDRASGPVTLDQNFTIFGSEESIISVSPHGTISFGMQYVAHAPRVLPVQNTPPLVLLFWTDTDITNRGSIHYREANDSSTLSSALQLLPSHQRAGFSPISAFIATWYNVPQTFSDSGDTNTYQAVLMTDGLTSFVCFLYRDIDWGSRVQIGFNAGDGNRSFTVPGALTNATLYMYRMSNVGRPGLFVYEVNGTEIGITESPTQLTISQVSQTSLQLHWTYSHSGLVYYNVYCYHASCPYCSHLPTVGTVTTTSTVARVSGLTSLTQYECCVTAVSSTYNEESLCSEQVRGTTLPARPTRPVGVIVTNTSRTSISLKWSRPEIVNGTLFYYEVTCLNNLNKFNVSFIQSINKSATVSNLRLFTVYTCCVSATNEGGQGNETCVETRTRQAPPSEPQQVATASTLTTSVRLTWSEPAESYGEVVLFYTVNCTSPTLHTVTVGRVYNTTVSVLGLHAGSNYTCCVFASSSVGMGLQKCTIITTNKAALVGSDANMQVVAAVTGGVLSSLLMILVVVVFSILCYCFCKRRTNKQTQNAQKSSENPVYDIPEDIELKQASKPSQNAPQNNERQSHRQEYKEDVEIRYEKPVLASNVVASINPRTKKPLAPPSHAPINPLSNQNEEERVYQPLIPAKTYKGPQETSAYQDLAFETRESKEGVVNNSEYETVQHTEGVSAYEPLSFGGGGREEGAYQPLTFRGEESSIYEHPQPTPT